MSWINLSNRQVFNLRVLELRSTTNPTYSIVCERCGSRFLLKHETVRDMTGPYCWASGCNLQAERDQEARKRAERMLGPDSNLPNPDGLTIKGRMPSW